MTVRHYVISFIPVLLVSLISCTTVTSENTINKGAVLLMSNASPVDFVDLYEFHGDVSSPVDKKVTRYEGFFDQYKEGSYGIPKDQQHGGCLSPEAEWMVYFPLETQNKINLLMGDIASWDKPEINDEFRNLKVELRGMIEGKWLDVLRNESREPKWIKASGGNNVVSKSINAKQLVFTLGQLDRRLIYGGYGLFPRIAIYRVQKNMQPDEQKPEYFSSFDDLAKSDLIKTIIEGNREPVLAIMKAVLKKFNAIHKDNPGMSIKGINFSAKGNNAALVNSPERIEMAKAAPFYTKCWYALRYFTTNRPRIGMRLITDKAVNEKRNCLADGEKYVLYLYDEKNEKIGAATLSLKDQ